MPLDRHPNTVIIHDLDAEIAEIDTAEAAARAQEQELQEGTGYEFVLPEEVERVMRGVPAHVLKGQHLRESSALVLYRPPAGLSLDNVEETRQGKTVKDHLLEERRRERQQQQQQQPGDVDMASLGGANNHYAMEIEREADSWRRSRGPRENTSWPLSIRNWANVSSAGGQQDTTQAEQEDDWGCDAMDIE